MRCSLIVPQVDEASAPGPNKEADKINEFVRGLKYDNRTAAAKVGEKIQSVVKIEGQGDDAEFTIIKREKKSIEGDQLPEISVVNGQRPNTYPGALLKANTRLAEGMPDPIIVSDRAPVTLRVDLANAGDIGNTTVKDPTYGNVSASIDNVVKAWGKENPYQQVSANQAANPASLFGDNTTLAELQPGYGSKGSF